MREYTDGDYKVTEYDNGAVIRELIGVPYTPDAIEPQLTEAEQRELDRDEMLIDLLIQQQEILLELQTQAAN